MSSDPQDQQDMTEEQMAEAQLSQQQAMQQAMQQHGYDFCLWLWLGVCPFAQPPPPPPPHAGGARRRAFVTSGPLLGGVVETVDVRSHSK